MKCEKCGGEWIPPKDISVSFMNCPFCNAPILNAETARSYQDMGEFLHYLVSLYGTKLYEDRQKLNNLIADLYQGEERMKRVYRRAIFDDSLSKRVYDLSLKPLNEREVYYQQLVNQFAETNFYTVDFGKQVIKSFTSGLQLEVIVPISTKATAEDGEWIDEFGVKYSIDRRKLIKGNSSLRTYKIREGTAVICDEAFCDYNSLTNITIPDSVTSIGDWAFSYCKSLTSIIIPSSVTSIGGCAFYDCKSLTNITIPDSVTSIEIYAFHGCDNLIISLESNKHFMAIDGILYTANMNILLDCYFQKSGSISIPNSVTNIRKGAFDGCEFLTNITIPDSVTSIGIYAFRRCKSLINIVIPNSVTSIGDSAFNGCESLTNITIPDSVTSISGSAFNGCCQLLISLTGTRYFTLKDDVLYTADETTLIWCPCKNKEYVNVPNSVTSIGDYAFRLCERLTSIIIPDSVTSIGIDTFYGCKSLTNITIPNSVTNIGIFAFKGCESLTNITIPDSVTSIGDFAFEDCKSLTNIIIPLNSIEKFKRLLPERLHPLLKESI